MPSECLCMFQSSEKAVQKKAYSCLEAVLSGSSPNHRQFQERHLDQLRALLVDSLSTVSAGSKKVKRGLCTNYMQWSF